MLIRVWMRTAVRKEVTSFGTFLLSLDAQLLAIAVIFFLTFSNTLGLRYGKVIQNVAAYL